ncbi:MAG: hypothetical protein COA74_15030 [Gammaproteobacteria bacterium]|nr:MAG: hypothetical protein COA74_15030 [Gammaproteobacteria bacterium]
MQYEEIAVLFPDFLDDNLSPENKQKVIDALEGSIDLQKALTSLKELRYGQQVWADEDIPSWNRSAFITRARPRASSWMNWFSLATSVAAICLVVFRVQLVSNNDGYHISFGEQANKVSFQKYANDYLDDWQSEQTAYLDHRLLEFENQQLQQSQQVLTSALEFNRDQRRQDLNQLTSYFLQQRSVDLVKSQSQYKQLVDSQLEDRQDIKSIYASLDN